MSKIIHFGYKQNNNNDVIKLEEKVYLNSKLECYLLFLKKFSGPNHT